MKLLNNLKIGTRLTIAFLTIVVIAASGFTYLLIKTRVIKKEIDSIYSIHLVSIDYLIQADRDAYQSSISISQSMSTYSQSNKEVKNKLITSIKENVDQVSERYGKFEKITPILSNPDNIKNNEIFHNSYKKVNDLTNKLIDLIRGDNYNEIEKIYFNDYEPEFETMREVMNVFTEISEKQAELSYNNSVELSNKIVFSSLIIIILIVLFITISAIVLTRSITLPIFTAVKLLDKLAKGNLNIKVPKTYRKRRDEVGHLLQSMSAMINNLTNIVQTIKQNSEQIASASLQLNNTSQILSQGATEQASSVEEVSSTMEEISANITQNSDNSVETEKISEASANGMQKIAETSKESLDSINNISQKITIINDIAFQTNILALNAAVEAARAGIHGKGFAVVASEVRKLAEKSQIAAEEIIGLSNQSVKITQEASVLMHEILPEVSKTARLVEEISASSAEQSNGALQVNNALQQLNNITQQNAASSEELASSAEELSSQAEALSSLVSFFKVENSSGIKHSKKSFNKQFQKKIQKKVQKKEVKTEEKKSQQEVQNEPLLTKGVNLNIDDAIENDESFTKY